MNAFTHSLSELGAHVIRFEFPYMQIRRAQKSKRPPDRAPKLINHFKDELTAVLGARGTNKLFLGGKSMGGRMASMLVSQERDITINGVVALGYPFHPPGKIDQLRTDHLTDLSKPMLVCQGTRDKLGNLEEVTSLSLPNKVDIAWFEDGDHDLKPRVKSGLTHDQHICSAANKVWQFMAAN